MPSTINKYEQDDYMHLDKKSFRILRSRLGSLSIPVDPFKSDVKFLSDTNMEGNSREVSGSPLSTLASRGERHIRPQKASGYSSHF
ncbi:hypothetical protein N7471_004873 [Penicillium samsonianum]|uniref:uncharacterized protein n=1 Tax=Penicillium samsonianum TaxID=1882272 RepID=UPI002547CC58|nr:uncharacterized protein N7471_004873 [Penicillium samsonianum]KAJ6138387.1 hypothetical protein N7471_004873 [Penicillium samsonianum]